jgi:hypothetical protein
MWLCSSSTSIIEDRDLSAHLNILTIRDFEADLLNVHVDFPLFQRLALPIQVGRSKIPGIKIQDTRMMRLMEVLLHGGSQVVGWRAAQIYESIRAAFELTAEQYTLTQLRYDMRKMKGHGLVERDGQRYCYRLTDKGKRVAAVRPLPSADLRAASQLAVPSPA